MAHIEQKKKANQDYLAYVKKFSLLGKQYRIMKHIGPARTTISKMEFILHNLNALCDEEFLLRKPVLPYLRKHMTGLVEQVERQAIRIQNLTEAKQNREYLDREFAKEFIFNSNNIEGSRIPAQVVRKILEKGRVQYPDRNEIKEVFNSIDAFNYIRKEFRFNIASIKRLYYLLTKDLKRTDGSTYPRGFKKVPIVVNNQETTAPEQVEQELQDLLRWYQQNKKRKHPFILAFDFHLRYEHIHPFTDANGRTGRLLLNKILMGGGYFPMIVLKNNKQAYFRSLAKAPEQPTAYYEFMLHQMKKTYTRFLQVAQR
ncbi:MAG: Fic family protein [DPANN group archaeon]|nr:Fic family protein [DPANN group archaeon]